MESLSITQAIVAFLLEKASPSLADVFRELLTLRRWQQSPVPKLMVSCLGLVRRMQEAATHIIWELFCAS